MWWEGKRREGGKRKGRGKGGEERRERERVDSSEAISLIPRSSLGADCTVNATMLENKPEIRRCA